MLTTAEDRYHNWLAQKDLDEEIAAELNAIRGNRKEIAERFCGDLRFGTGGLRGILGAGSNRMNVYTVRRATQGLANYLKRSRLPQSAAISYDSRIKSDVFARETARVLCANGILVYLYPRLEPTPALSWAVRYYRCGAGVCITASHNPASYNGYKVYGMDGCQITLEAAEKITWEIESSDWFDDVETVDFDDAVKGGRIRYISETCLDSYLDEVCAQRIGDGKGISRLKLIYTPLNGSGMECVSRLFEKLGVEQYTAVPEQELPDGRFPTCPYPNPEVREAMELGLSLCRSQQPDLLIGTDPDCDRCGVAIPDSKRDYRLLSGNEIGVLLLDYVCKTRLRLGTMPVSPVAVTTIVSTPMASAVAGRYGVELRRTLTGFKFIGEQIGLLESTGEAQRYIFGFEESYGYLSGTYVRDKDAVNAVLLVCESAAWYAGQGLTLLDALDILYEEFGYYQDELKSYGFEGAEGMEKTGVLMQNLRRRPPSAFGGFHMEKVVDYMEEGTGLPRADVLEFRLEGGMKAVVRPSGTEPKIKTYLSAIGKSREEAAERMQKLKDAAEEMIHIM